MVSKSKPFFTAQDTQNEVPESKNVCISTVKRIFRPNGLFRRVAASKCFFQSKIFNEEENGVSLKKAERKHY